MLLVIVVPALMVLEGASARRAAKRADEDEEAASEPPTFPVPPMDLVVPSGRKARPMASVSAPSGIEPAPDEKGERDE